MAWLLLAAGLVLLVALVGLWAEGGDGSLEPRRFEAAMRCGEPAVMTSLRRLGLQALLEQPLPAPGDCWTPVALPQAHPAQGISAPALAEPVRRLVYRVQLSIPATWEGELLGLHVPRASGLAWQVWVDGVPVSNSLGDWRMSASRPIDVELPLMHVRRGQVVMLDVGLLQSESQGHSMSRITVGPSYRVQHIAVAREFLQRGMPQAASAAILALGLFFFAFWLARRADTEYLLLAASSLVWSLCNLQYVLPRRDDPVWDAWYSALVEDLPIAWLNWFVYLLSARFAARPLRLLGAWLPVYVLVFSVLALPLWGGSQNLALLNKLVYTAVGVSSIFAIGWMTWVNRSRELSVIALALFLCSVLSVNDLALRMNRANPESLYLIPYGGVLVFGAFLYALQRRYVHAINRSERHGAELAQRLAEREEQLQREHQRVMALERAQTLTSERQRLLKDMHDGPGSTLSASLRLAEDGCLRQEDVVHVLRDAVDEMRSVISSLETHGHDVATLLGELRLRLARRFAAAGVVVTWQIEEVPPLPWLEPGMALHLLRWAQEVLANVLRHAHATQVVVSVEEQAGWVRIAIRDDGCGIDRAGHGPHPGRGMRHLEERAAALHARHSIHSRPGHGTCITLDLPFDLPARRLT